MFKRFRWWLARLILPGDYLIQVRAERDEAISADDLRKMWSTAIAEFEKSGRKRNPNAPMLLALYVEGED